MNWTVKLKRAYFALDFHVEGVSLLRDLVCEVERVHGEGEAISVIILWFHNLRIVYRY